LRTAIASKKDACVVLNGSGRIRLDDEVHELRQWDVVLGRRPRQPQTVRAIEAGDEGLEFLGVSSDRPEGGDGIHDPKARID
jgi:hypothetical protein